MRFMRKVVGRAGGRGNGDVLQAHGQLVKINARHSGHSGGTVVLFPGQAMGNIQYDGLFGIINNRFLPPDPCRGGSRAAVPPGQPQTGQSRVADIDIIIILGGIVARSEMHFQFAGRGQAGTVVRPGQGAVQKLHSVKIRGYGDTLDFRRHGLKFAVDHQTLVGIVRARGGLFG